MFTIRKFLSFSIERQHKKCAEQLRSVYELLLQKADHSTALDEYNTIHSWMGSTVSLSNNHKLIADRYHWHLQQANQHIRENNFLPAIRRNDKPTASSTPYPIAIYLDHLRSAHNIGSILRTTEAMLLGSLYFSPDSPFIDNKQVQDTSMGTYEWVNCHQDATLTDLPKPIIALETSPQAISIHHFIFPEIFTLVIGNEEYGCSDDALKQADYIIEIPLQGRKNSLNVANAFAICAAEIQRQKNLIKDPHEKES